MSATGWSVRGANPGGWTGAGSQFAPRSRPGTAEAFADAVILAICSASVTAGAGRRSFERCRVALRSGSTSRLGFRHPGKAGAIDAIWRDRHRLYREYQASSDKLAYLATLPWIGPVTRRSLARNLGLPTGEDQTRSVC